MDNNGNSIIWIGMVIIAGAFLLLWLGDSGRKIKPPEVISPPYDSGGPDGGTGKWIEDP